jgi:amidase
VLEDRSRPGGTALADLTIDAVHSALVRGETSAEALTQAHLDRIATVDAVLNSIVTAAGDAALERAQELDADFAAYRRFAGPLHGVPVVVKDVFETAGVATAFGSAAFDGYVPTADATVVARLKRAGAIVIGKTALPDFAASWHGHSSRSGITRNPYDLARDPGGSSGGTAVAVAAGLAVAGIGTDTGGSIRVPASFCGLVGLRPTPGLISRAGAMPLVSEQDSPGPMTRSVTDAALLLDVLAGRDPGDPLTASDSDSGARRPHSYTATLARGALSSARLGVLRVPFSQHSDPREAEVDAVFEAALADLRLADTEIVDQVEIQGLAEDLIETFFYFAQSRHDINEFLATRSAGHIEFADIVSAGKIWPTMVLLYGMAAGPTDPYLDPTYGRKRARRQSLIQKIAGLFADYQLDALIFPDVRIAAPLRADIEAGRWEEAAEGVNHPDRAPFPVNTLLAAQACLPAITVPAGHTPAGLPVGLEFMGLRYSETTLLRLAFDFESVTHHRRPPIVATS